MICDIIDVFHKVHIWLFRVFRRLFLVFSRNMVFNVTDNTCASLKWRRSWILAILHVSFKTIASMMVVIIFTSCSNLFNPIPDTNVWEEQINIVFQEVKKADQEATLNSVGFSVNDSDMPLAGSQIRLTFSEPKGGIICSDFDNEKFTETFKIERCGTFKGDFNADWHDRFEEAFRQSNISPTEALQQTMSDGAEWLRVENTKGSASIGVSFHPLDEKDLQHFGVAYAWIVVWTVSNDQGIKELIFLVNPTDGTVLERKERSR